MRVLAVLLLTLSLPVPRLAPLSRPLVDHAVNPRAHNGGQWYLAGTGHAVFCYGPVMLVRQPQGGLQRVATYCRGNLTMVPLKD